MHLYLADAGAVTDATELMRRFGEDAVFEAQARADRSRSVGNHLQFCRWRQVERLIEVLDCEEAIGTVH